MPKINRFQIINFRYSKNGIRLLTDKIMVANGESTQFEATNSVGKSMQIQTLLQSVCPLADVNKKAIDIYKVKQPVYSLIEWILNDGETLLLTGIGFERKSVSLDEDSNANTSNRKNEVFKYFTFTIEYENNQNLTLDNIGIIEYDENDNKKINSLAYVENKLRNLAKGSNGKINVFAQSSNVRYSEKLYEYGISQKEYKDVIVKLNSGEYTLNSFFEQYDTTEKLLKYRIFPLIDDTLVSANDVPRIKEQKNNVLEFMNTVVENRDAVDNYNELTELLKMIESTNDWLDKTILSENEKIEAIHKLSDLYYLCEQKYMEVQNLISEEKTLLDNYESEKVDIEFKEKSYKYRLDEDEINNIKSNIDSIDSKIADAKLKLEEYITDLNTLKLNEIENDIKECLVEKSKVAAEKELLSIEHQDLVEKMKEIGSNIKHILLESISLLETNIGDSTGAILELNEVISSEREKINKYSNELSTLNAKIDSFANLKSKFTNRFDNLCKENEILENYIVRQLDKVEIKFDSLLVDLNKEINDIEAYVESLKKEIENLKESIKSSTLEKSNLASDINKLSLKKQKLENLLQSYKEYKNNVDVLVSDYELDESKLWDKDLKVQAIEYLVNSFNESKEKMVISKHNILDELSRLKKGGLIKISQELLDELKSHGITPIMGSEYLIQNKDKAHMLNLNPLMPYSLIVTQSEYNKLLKMNIKTFSDALIPIIIRENINVDDNMKVFNISEGLIYSKDSSFLKSIDLSVLDPELKKEKISLLEKNIISLDKSIEDIANNINKVIKIRAELIRVDFSKDDIEEISSSISDIENEINSNKEDIILKDSLINSCNLKISELESSIKTNNSKLINTKKMQSQLSVLSEDFSEIEKNSELEIEYKNNIVILKKKIDLSNDEIRGFSGILEVEKDKRFNFQKELESKNNTLSKFNIYEPIKTLDINLDEAIARYNALSKDSTGINISELDKRLSTLENRYNKLVLSKDDLIGESKGLIHKEAVTILLNKSDLRSNIDSLQKDINALQKESRALYNTKAQKEGALDEQSKTIVRDFGKGPCNREDIDNVNFKECLKAVKLNIEDCKKKIKSYDRDYIRLETMLKDLEKHKQDRRAFKIDTSLDVECLKELLELEVSNANKDLAYNSNKYSATIVEIDDFNVKLDSKYDNIVKVIRVNKDSYSKQKEALINITTFITEQLKIYAYNKEFVTKIKDTIVMDLVNYCKDVMEQLRVFNRLGTIKGEKFFEFKLPNEDNIRYKETIDDIMTNLMESGSEKEVVSKIDTYYMLNRLISISSLKTMVMLLELKGRREKLDWNTVKKNTSGGQCFSISFVVLTLLLEYRRYDSKKISNTTESKVLIMDNPFGETSECEFLGHMFDLAEKFDVQIISYTHITNYSVRESFKRIYKMTVEQTVGGKEIVLIENEKIQEEEYVNQFKYHISTEQQQFLGFEEIL